MEWHHVTFEVKVQPGQAGKDIVNTATAGGDNVDKPNKPNHEVKVYPRDPVLCQAGWKFVGNDEIFYRTFSYLIACLNRVDDRVAHFKYILVRIEVPTAAKRKLKMERSRRISVTSPTQSGEL